MGFIISKAQLQLDKLGMLLSYKRAVDGLWLGVLGDKSDDHLLCRVQEALALIKQHDLVRYERLRKDVERIWISTLIGASGNFSSVGRRCNLDRSFVELSSAELVASVIVHEATHAHPCLRKFGYPEALRYRIEQICMRQQVIFARKLPEGGEVREEAERSLTREPCFWSNAAFKARRPAAVLAAARSVGIPDWFTKSLQILGKALARLRRRLR